MVVNTQNIIKFYYLLNTAKEAIVLVVSFSQNKPLVFYENSDKISQNIGVV